MSINSTGWYFRPLQKFSVMLLVVFMGSGFAAQDGTTWSRLMRSLLSCDKDPMTVDVLNVYDEDTVDRCSTDSITTPDGLTVHDGGELGL